MARLPLAPLALALLSLLPAVAQAQRRPFPARADQSLRADVRDRARTADTLATFRTRTVRRHGARGRLDVRAGVLRALYRIEARTDVGAGPEGVARAYLAEHAASFGLDSTLKDLETQRVQAGRSSAHVVFQQTFRGVPVYGRQVKVNLDRRGQPSMVLSGYAPGLPRTASFNPQPAYPDAEARTRAEALLEGPARTSEPDLVVYPSEAPRLAWRLLAWPESGAAEWEVLLDARTGEPIQLLDQTTHRGGGEWGNGGKGERRKGGKEEGRIGGGLDVRPGPSGMTSAPQASPFAPNPTASHSPFAIRHSLSVDGLGLVFDPDPLTSAGRPYEAPFTDADDADVPELNAQRKEVPLRDITRGRDGLYRLEGPYVQITGESGIGGTAYAPPAERRPDAFRYGRADDGFEAVMAYYHIDASQRHVQALGLDRAIQEAPIRVNPHGLGDDDQSRFYPAQNALAFGTGGIDDAEDADVIWHEYGHALLEGSAPGLLGTTEGQALHEGWADYWAASYARSLVEAGLVPEGDWRQLFPWDGPRRPRRDGEDGNIWQGRTLDHAGRYPDDLTGNIYTDGVLWATTLMEVYDDVGRETTDRLSLHSHAYLSHPVTMQDAAEALLQADEDLHGGAHLGVLLERLGARGFIDVGAYGPIIVHEPLLATEQQGGSVAFDVGVSGPTSPVEAVAVFYRSADGSFERLALTSGADSVYSGALPLPGEPGTVAYYIEATDALGRQARRPAGAPQTLYRFDVGADKTELPKAPRLDAVHPNPLSGSAIISYTLPEAADVRLEVYDLLGRRVAVLAEGAKTARTHTVTLDGSGLASGAYLVRLLAGGRQDTRRVVVLR